jgi:1,4-alpha-glucan branching enzyme
MVLHQLALPWEDEMHTTVPSEEIIRIVNTDHYDPFKVLGLHLVDQRGKTVVSIRAFLPDAREAFVVWDESDESHGECCMTSIHNEGFFEALIPGKSSAFRYRLRTVDSAGVVEEFNDSYAFMPTLTEFDLYLFNEGTHYTIYEKLGSHFAEVDGIGGVQFAVWAPSARSVSVIGSFNNWDRRKHAMRVLGNSGVWEIFVPGLADGELYKFQIKTQDGKILDKADPFATQMEIRPRTASVVNFLNEFEWGDGEWMRLRQTPLPYEKPIAIYEVHLGSWRRMPHDDHRCLSYREAAKDLVRYVKSMGYTHIELLPILEHPFDGSWGYQVTGYFAPTSRFGRPEDFMFFVDYCHQNNIGLILDWVPAHFPRDPYALARFDGTCLFEHADPRQGEHPDWDTLIFNYGRREVSNFLIASAIFWLERYHIDGLRIDAVASMLYLDYSRKPGEWIPNRYGGRENLEAIEFIKHLNSVIHDKYPGVLSIAEESTAWPGVTTPLHYGGLGFDLKWNMGWMHDILEYFSKEPVYRKYHHNNLTFALLYAFSERFLLPLSHDEVVHGKSSLLGKMPGDDWQKFANLRLLLGVMYGFPGKKLLFMGGEFGQWSEWNHDHSLEWHLLDYDMHVALQRWVCDLNSLYKSEPALYEIDFHHSGFEWIDFRDVEGSTISFIRKGRRPDEAVIFICNFTPVPRYQYRIGVPPSKSYREILNSDSAYYGGGNVGNSGSVMAEQKPWHNQSHSVLLTLPPLGVVVLKQQH